MQTKYDSHMDIFGRATAHALPEPLQHQYLVPSWGLRPLTLFITTQLHLPRESPHQHANTVSSILLPRANLVCLAVQPHAQTVSKMLSLDFPLPLHQTTRDPRAPDDLAGAAVVLAALLGQDVGRN